MVHKLPLPQYPKVRGLFSRLCDFQAMCVAVLNRNYPGNIFVDDLSHPNTALLTTYINKKEHGLWAFLAGTPKNPAFLQSLNQGLFEKQIIKESVPSILFTPDPNEDWSSGLEQVMSPLPPIPFPRLHFSATSLSYDWQSDVPAGITIRKIDRDLYENKEYQLPDEVADIVHKWYRIMKGKTDDFGFVALDGKKVVSWMTIDFVSNGEGDVGVQTLSDYRRRGLAAITSAASMEYAFSHGIKKIHWTCTAQNTGSMNTASKLGYTRGDPYQMHILIFDHAQHWSNYAYEMLLLKKYEDSMDAFLKAFSLSENHPDWVFYAAARTAAALGKKEKAFECLSSAVVRGWKNRDDAERCEEFVSLYEYPHWKVVLEKMAPSEVEQNIL